MQISMFLSQAINIIDEKYLPIIKKMLAEASPDTIVFPSAQSVKMFFEEEVCISVIPA